MEITNEKEVKFCEMEVEMSEEEVEFLSSYGLEKIKEDKNELINYAFNVIIKDTIKTKYADHKRMLKDLHKIHNHPGMERRLNLDSDHVIIDREIFEQLLFEDS